MEIGCYKKNPIMWEEWEAHVFVPHLFNIETYGCGANTLALLTGIPPSLIQNPNLININDWRDDFMVKFLRQNGFRVKHITKCDVSNTNASTGYASDYLNDRHVLLMSQLMNKNTASWTVAHNKLWYHNFQTCSFTPISMLNQPTLTCYLVIHPYWRQENWIDLNKKRRYYRKNEFKAR